MMDKRTRVLNALNQREVDHVPVGLWYHFYNEEAQGDRCVEAHLQYYRETDLDFLKVMNDGFTAYPFPQGIDTPEDWYRLRPLAPDDPFIEGQVERAAKVVQAMGKERCVFYNVFAPLPVLRMTFGYDRIQEDIRQNKNAVLYALDTIAYSLSLLVRRLITEAGCDGIYYPVQGAEYGRFTPEEYRQLIEPSNLYVLQQANRYSDNNILHCCGWAGAQNQVEVWKDYPAKCVNWAIYVEKLSAIEGRNLFQGRACLCGFETLWSQGKLQGLIYEGTKEEIQAYTRSLIADFGKRGLLLGGDCTLDASIDLERIRWIVEAARSV